MRTKAFPHLQLWLAIVVLVVFLIIAGIGIGGCTTSNGSRVGLVTKLSYKGYIFRSWEGEMLVGKGESANVWAFSVIDKSLVNDVKAAMLKGHRVEIEYTQQFFTLTRDTSYIVTHVNPLD